jgi:hypothetical protein
MRRRLSIGMIAAQLCHLSAALPACASIRRSPAPRRGRCAGRRPAAHLSSPGCRQGGGEGAPAAALLSDHPATLPCTRLHMQKSTVPLQQSVQPGITLYTIDPPGQPTCACRPPDAGTLRSSPQRWAVRAWCSRGATAACGGGGSGAVCRQSGGASECCCGRRKGASEPATGERNEGMTGGWRSQPKLGFMQCKTTRHVNSSLQQALAARERRAPAPRAALRVCVQRSRPGEGNPPRAPNQGSSALSTSSITVAKPAHTHDEQQRNNGEARSMTVTSVHGCNKKGSPSDEERQAG